MAVRLAAGAGVMVVVTVERVAVQEKGAGEAVDWVAVEEWGARAVTAGWVVVRGAMVARVVAEGVLEGEVARWCLYATAADLVRPAWSHPHCPQPST